MGGRSAALRAGCRRAAGIYDTIILAAFVLTIGVLLGLTFARWGARDRLERHRRAGASAELHAVRLLRRAGYRVLAREAPARLTVLVDGAPREFDVRADLLLTRRRRRYLAEIKSTRRSGDVGHRATRRQMLEYACTFDVDGLLLVDVARGQVRTIEFPSLRRSKALPQSRP